MRVATHVDTARSALVDAGFSTAQDHESGDCAVLARQTSDSAASPTKLQVKTMIVVLTPFTGRLGRPVSNPECEQPTGVIHRSVHRHGGSVKDWVKRWL